MTHRRTAIRMLTFVIAAFAALLGLVYRLERENEAYRRRISLNYARAFSQLTESMGNLDTSLEKCIYVTSPEMISGLCAEVFSDAAAARQAASALPYANVELEQTISFATRAGDYAQALSRAAAEQRGYRDEDVKNLKALSQAASSLSDELDELEAQLNEGTLTLEDVEAVQLRLSRSTEGNKQLEQGSFAALEDNFPELPTLIYDGPFSEHMQSRRSAMLEQEQSVTVAQARKKAAAFLGLEERLFSEGEPVEGQIPCYRFRFSTPDCSDCTVDMTQKGGYVLGLTNGRAVGPARMKEQEAIQRAKAWLEAHDITDLTESYSLRRDNALTINFAAVQDGVICYPDLLKVEVALDNGEIVGMESAGFLMNHTHRDDLKPQISWKKARTAVSPELTILSRHLVLIPTQGGHEKLCWEFRCQNGDNKHYLVHINAQTGAEEEILILLEDETGTLAL